MKGNYSLVGIDGNAFSVMGYVSSCMKSEHKTEKEIKDYTTEAMSGSYDDLLCTSMNILEQLNEGN